MGNYLPFPIFKEIKIDNYRIVLLDDDYIPKNSSYKNRNVLCLDEKDNLIWQIEDVSIPGKEKVCPFRDMHYTDNELLLLNWCDIRLTVDHKTGRIVEKEIGKF